MILLRYVFDSALAGRYCLINDIWHVFMAYFWQYYDKIVACFWHYFEKFIDTFVAFDTHFWLDHDTYVDLVVVHSLQHHDTTLIQSCHVFDISLAHFWPCWGILLYTLMCQSRDTASSKYFRVVSKICHNFVMKHVHVVKKYCQKYATTKQH